MIMNFRLSFATLLAVAAMVSCGPRYDEPVEASQVGFAVSFFKNVNAVESVEEAIKTTDSSGTPGGGYYMKDADQIATKEGNVVVWNYWPERYFIGFMEITRKLGYTYEEV